MNEHDKDKDILVEISSAQNKKYIETENILEINGEIYELERRNVNGIFSIVLPKSFIEMDEEIKGDKYPSKYRPQIVFTNEDTDINFTFSYMEVQISKNKLAEIILGFKSVIKKMNPTNTFYDIIIREDNYPPMAHFDYRSDALDDEIYNIMFVTAINNNLLLGSFSCRFRQKEDYELFADRIIVSVRETEGEDNE